MKKAISLAAAVMLLLALTACGSAHIPVGATITDTVTGAPISLGQTQKGIEKMLRSEGEYNVYSGYYNYWDFDLAIIYEQDRAVEIFVFGGEDRYSIAGYTPGTDRSELDSWSDWDLVNGRSYYCYFDKDGKAVARSNPDVVYRISISFNDDGTWGHIVLEFFDSELE